MKLFRRLVILVWLISLSTSLRYVIGEPQDFGTLQHLEHLRFFVPASVITSVLILLLFGKYLVTKRLKKAQFFTILLLFFVICLGLLFAAKPELGIFWLALIIIYFLAATALICFLKIDKSGREFVLISVVILSSLQALLGVLQFALGHTLGLTMLGEISADESTLGVAKVVVNGLKYLRPVGFFQHANIFGGYLLVGLAALIAWISQPKSTRLIAWAPLFLGSIMLGILFSFSRSTWIAGILMVVAASVYCYSFRHVVKIPLIIVFIAALLTIPGIKSRLQISEQSQQITLRSDLNNYGLALFHDKPLFGNGLKQEVYQRSTLPNLKSHEIQPPHNSFILLLSEIGLLGVTLLFLLLGITFLTGKNKLERFSIFIVPFIPILLYDHYPISLYTGIGLISLLIVITSLHKRDQFYVEQN